MQLLKAILAIAAGVLSWPAAAQSADELRRSLLIGDFQQVADAAARADAAKAGSRTLFELGLGAFGAGNYGLAAQLLAQAVQTESDPQRAVRAAVIATLALSNSGQRESACDYSAAILPLIDSQPLLYRGWIKEARQADNCG